MARHLRGRCRRIAGGPRPSGATDRRGVGSSGGILIFLRQSGRDTAAPLLFSPLSLPYVPTGVEEFDVRVGCRSRNRRDDPCKYLFPNGSGKNRQLQDPLQTQFLQALFDAMEEMKTEHYGHWRLQYRPSRNRSRSSKTNTKTSGFRPMSEELDRWLTSGWVDTFRHVRSAEGHTPGGAIARIRERNVGWRSGWFARKISTGVLMPYSPRGYGVGSLPRATLGVARRFIEGSDCSWGFASSGLDGLFGLDRFLSLLLRLLKPLADVFLLLFPCRSAEASSARRRAQVLFIFLTYHLPDRLATRANMLLPVLLSSDTPSGFRFTQKLPEGDTGQWVP